MNNELRCHLRLRVKIPNEILLLIEKYLWQLNIVWTQNIITWSTGLAWLHLNKYRGRYPYFTFWRCSGKSENSKSHLYGPHCLYNKTLAIDRQNPFGPSVTNITCIHNGRLEHSIWLVTV